ncbi:hypothetical protein [Maribacter forsetii]|uniref:hypothetical protein n=1 Tax=Maribacter forsetii TaxID=444515 RepID=UPI0005670406|nr:hypothetical protein [Maribacter forsetii]
MSRIELENYKNALLFDDFILLSQTHYQSVEDFKNRASNSKNDELKKVTDIQRIEYHSIGNILTLRFNDGEKTLKFFSNQSMMEFLEQFEMENFSKVSQTNLDVKTSILPILIPVLIGAIIISVALTKYGPKGFFKFIPLVAGFIMAMVLIVKKYLSSSFIVFEKTKSLESL